MLWGRCQQKMDVVIHCHELVKEKARFISLKLKKVHQKLSIFLMAEYWAPIISSRTDKESSLFLSHRG